MTLESLPSSAQPAAAPDFRGLILYSREHALTIDLRHGELHLCIIVDDEVVCEDASDAAAVSLAKKNQLHRFIFVPILHGEALALAEGKTIDFGPVATRAAYVSDRTFDDAAPVWMVPARDILTPELLAVDVAEPAFMAAQVTQWLCSYHSHPARGGGQCHCGMRAEESW
jgi:hypothetical protein